MNLFSDFLRSFSKKRIFFIALFFLCVFFGKSLCLSVIGTFVRGYFHFQKGLDFTYRSIDLTRKGLIFIDPMLQQKNGFSCNASKVVIALIRHHIEIETPHLVFFEIPDWHADGTNGFSCFFHNGIFESKGILQGTVEGDVYFSGEYSEGRLRGKEISKEGLFQNLNGSVNWKGSVDQMDWDLEFSVIAKEQKIYGSGRQCARDQVEPWRELNLHYADGSLSASSREFEGFDRWDIVFDSLTPDLVSCIQEAVAQIDVSWPTIFTFQEGIASGSISLFYEAGRIANWRILDFLGKDLMVRHEMGFFGCKEIWMNEELYVFHSGKFSCVLPNQVILSGENLEGSLDAVGGRFSGQVGDYTIFLETHGAIDSFRSQLNFQGPSSGETSFNGRWDGESLHLEIQEGSLFSPVCIDHLEMEAEIALSGISLHDVRGVLHYGKSFSFFCPVVQSNGVFDLRLNENCWDLVRFVGKMQGESVFLDETRSHILGSPVHLEGNLRDIHLLISLPWKDLPTLCPIPLQVEKFPIAGALLCDISYEKEKGFAIDLSDDHLKWDKEEVFLRCCLHQEGSNWKLETSQILDFFFEGNLEWDQEGIVLKEGKGRWKDGLEAELQGRFYALDRWGIYLSHLRVDLHALSLGYGIEGILEGEGRLGWEGEIQSDFDLTAAHLKIGAFSLENSEDLHAHFSFKKGLSIRGLNPMIVQSELESSWADCKVGLLQYNFDTSLWTLTQSQFHLSPQCCETMKNQVKFLNAISIENGLNFAADIECSSDFSTFSCLMQEGFIPFHNEIYPVRNCHIDLAKEECLAVFDVSYLGQWIPINLKIQGTSHVKGRLMIQNELVVDWTYTDKLRIQAIEGKFSGVDSSFHLEGDSLIGSARIDCNVLKDIVPIRISELFSDLKMGKGYELMGRLYVGSEGVSFKGILSGKQVELFNFQLKTLLAQIELTPDHVNLQDIKISDIAGVMTIDQILAKGEGEDPWTLSIPHLTITELRPSLLREVGGAPGKLSPLVVRQLKMDHLEGLLDDRSTYVAQGELSFINSYKREDSILDIPLNVFSRIIGLDLDLLIPVRGTLHYELKNGLFSLNLLEDAYSENKRSEFFLVHNADSPIMDLDGNLNILIKMKQFVLFKFTEAFIIAISGKLDDPEFHLQSKKRFLDL